MNPYLILAGLLALAAAAGGGFYEGRVTGTNAQKVADQQIFEKVNSDLSKQKAEAADILAKANADNLALVTARDTLKTQLEKAHAANQTATNALAAQYAGERLRFALPSAGRGEGSPGAQGPSSDPASAQPATVVQLPETLERRLRGIALDADRLKDEYALCYGYAEQVR